jgi:hypothetical protein
MVTLTRRRLLLGTVMAVAALAACGPAPAPEPSGAGEPVISADENGLFRLELELPKATYAAGETIEGVTRLRYAGPGAIEVAGATGGLIGFSLIDVDGPRDVGGGQDAACAPYGLDPANPITTPLTKSGGYSPDDPADDFIEAFLSDPIYRLPAGTWEIQAWTNFLGQGCMPPETSLSTSVRITVTD